MCGITGYLGGEIKTHTKCQYILKKMSGSLYHRGPDQDGTWIDLIQRVGLAHRRLSILDLSKAGSQPMVSTNGRYVIVYNGEIYNHLKLRKQLIYPWKGFSDTETLLAGFENWGIKKTLKKVIGMFAVAIWDKQQKELILARDRIGEKPLYYGWQNGSFIFGSELKSIREHPDFQAEVDRDALCSYFRYAYVPTPKSIYEKIRKLEPGSILTVSLSKKTSKLETYWSFIEVAKLGFQQQTKFSQLEAREKLDALLKDSIQKQMISDVPIGAFLSGGIDSSTIAAIMQKISTTAIKTFTIGFDDPSQSEAIYAKKVARYLGTDHTELYVTADEAMGIIPTMPYAYCEPFADSSQLPTFLVSKMSRDQVTVALSGDGGDELFCGYNRYQITAKLWRYLKNIPQPIRKTVAKGLVSISPNKWNRAASFLPLVSPGDKLHKGAAVLDSSSLDDLYLGLVSLWKNPSDLVIGGSECLKESLRTDSPLLQEFNEIERMMILDSVSYLPDDILVKVDRASMMNSLETRAPFLDHRVIEFVWKIPMELKLRNLTTKSLLRDVLYQYVPKELIERPKMGFGLPIGEWLRGALRDWAEDLISYQNLKSGGYLKPDLIRKKWTEHLSGNRNWSAELWTVLMFQSWLRTQ